MLNTTPPASTELTFAEIDSDRQRIIHELQIHQLEIEAQNEQLRVTQLALELALADKANQLKAIKKAVELQEALDTNRQISVAIGILMVQMNIDQKSAFEVIRNTVRRQRRKLSEFAAELVSHFEKNIQKY
ncbi:MAG: ANTAR domain-containing protein [Methylovulum sp.]|jgi:hypothetical protein|nr:ANTAR domain-containing protein [Methylovulum sp.]MCF7997750.1 ANTAR domain-containing protein [Methylovulum sp.]